MALRERNHGTSPTIATVGYEKRSLPEFLTLLQGQRVDVLVDVRETPWSRKPGFSKKALSTALAAVGIEYVHAKFAGNPKRFRANAHSNADCLKRYSRYLRRRKDIVEEFDTLVGSYLSDKRRVCITCFERHPKECHRGILAEAWRRRGTREVEHLGTVDELR